MLKKKKRVGVLFSSTVIKIIIMMEPRYNGNNILEARVLRYADGINFISMSVRIVGENYDKE